MTGPYAIIPGEDYASLAHNVNNLMAQGGWEIVGRSYTVADANKRGYFYQTMQKVKEEANGEVMETRSMMDELLLPLKGHEYEEDVRRVISEVMAKNPDQYKAADRYEIPSNLLTRHDGEEFLCWLAADADDSDCADLVGYGNSIENAIMDMLRQMTCDDEYLLHHAHSVKNMDVTRASPEVEEALKDVLAVLAELPRSKCKPEWQPINTAPNNEWSFGIDLWAKEEWCPEGARFTDCHWKDHFGAWVCESVPPESFILKNVTHWMPVPKGPEESES